MVIMKMVTTTSPQQSKNNTRSSLVLMRPWVKQKPRSVSMYQQKEQPEPDKKSPRTKSKKLTKWADPSFSHTSFGRSLSFNGSSSLGFSFSDDIQDSKQQQQQQQMTTPQQQRFMSVMSFSSCADSAFFGMASSSSDGAQPPDLCRYESDISMTCVAGGGEGAAAAAARPCPGRNTTRMVSYDELLHRMSTAQPKSVVNNKQQQPERRKGVTRSLSDSLVASSTSRAFVWHVEEPSVEFPART